MKYHSCRLYKKNELVQQRGNAPLTRIKYTTLQCLNHATINQGVKYAKCFSV